MMKLMRAYVTPLAEMIERWVEQSRKKPGRLALAAGIIEGEDPYPLALLTLRLLLDKATKKRSLTSVAIALGGEVDLQRRLDQFAASSPGLYAKIDEHVNTSAEAYRRDYRRRVMVHALNRYREDITVAEKREMLLVGVALVDLAVQATGLVEIVSSRKGKKTTRYEVVATKAMLDWLKDGHHHCEALRPPRSPMVCPPAEWLGIRGGGYRLPAMQRPLCRLHKIKGAEQPTPETMPIVFEAINAYQSVPWSINKQVLDVLLHFWDNGLDVPGVCQMADKPLPARPKKTAPQEEIVRYKAKAREVRDFNTEQEGLRLATAATVAVARQSVGEPQLWLPCLLDFRGRFYYDSPSLTPQGHDLAKSLLMFSRGLPLGGPRGRYWLAVRAANTYGMDKLPLDERAAWAEANSDNMVAAARDPLNNSWWRETDEDPWQHLATCFEWERMLREGEDFRTHLVVWVDGSANGIQHLAALSRDDSAGRLVNLVPSDRPQDIYAKVAEEARQILHEYADMTPDSQRAADLQAKHKKPKKGEAVPWEEAFERHKAYAKQWLHYGIDRSLTKRPTMILPYGGTRQAVAKYTDDHITARVNKGKTHPFTHRGRATSWMAGVLWEAMERVIPGPMEVMAVMKRLARGANKQELPLVWTAPTGWEVRQAYPDRESFRIKTRLGDSVIRLQIGQTIPDTIRHAEQVTALAPNFIHALDAAAMMLVGRSLVQDHGITDVAFVHDSYGTHAPNMDTLVDVNRNTFADMHSRPLLQEFVEQITRDWLDKVSVPELPREGGLDIDHVRTSLYFFS
jgi:DNA-directed RNA polymerase